MKLIQEGDNGTNPGLVEKIKRGKHSNNFHKQQKDFYPFFLYVHGMLGKEALATLTNLIQIVAVKMEDPLLHM